MHRCLYFFTLKKIMLLDLLYWIYIIHRKNIYFKFKFIFVMEKPNYVGTRYISKDACEKKYVPWANDIYKPQSKNHKNALVISNIVTSQLLPDVSTRTHDVYFLLNGGVIYTRDRLIHV